MKTVKLLSPALLFEELPGTHLGGKWTGPRWYIRLSEELFESEQDAKECYGKDLIDWPAKDKDGEAIFYKVEFEEDY